MTVDHAWIARTLKEMRREKGLTQEKLATLAGLSRPVVMNLERGTSRSLYAIERVLDALGYELEVVRK